MGVQNEASQRLTVLPRERTIHSKHTLPTTQEKTLYMDMDRILKGLSGICIKLVNIFSPYFRYMEEG